MAANDNVAHAMAGAGGGALSMIVTYPLITLSTRAQTESKKSNKESATTHRPSVSALDAAKDIIKREGVSGLYSGLESALFGISITNFVYYYFYEGTRTMYENSKRASGNKTLNLSTVESIVAGAIAGSATVALTNPIWVVNTRMTVNGSTRKDPVTGKVLPAPSTLQTVKNILEHDGASAFLSGILPAMVLVINPILQYTVSLLHLLRVERIKAMTPS